MPTKAKEDPRTVAKEAGEKVGLAAGKKRGKRGYTPNEASELAVKASAKRSKKSAVLTGFFERGFIDGYLRATVG